MKEDGKIKILIVLYSLLILFPCNGEITAHTFSVKPDTKLHCIEEYNITQVEQYYFDNVKEKREKVRKIQKKQKSIFYKIFSKFRKTKPDEQVFNFYDYKIDKIYKSILTINSCDTGIEIYKNDNILYFLAGDIIFIYEIAKNKLVLINKIDILFYKKIEEKYKKSINFIDLPIPRALFVFEGKIYCFFRFESYDSNIYGVNFLFRIDKDGNNIEFIDLEELGVEKTDSLFTIGYDKIEDKVWVLSEYNEYSKSNISYLNYDNINKKFSIYEKIFLENGLISFMNFPIILNGKKIIFKTSQDGYIINLFCLNIESKIKTNLLNLGFVRNSAYYDGLDIEGEYIWTTSYGPILNDNKIKYSRDVTSWFDDDYIQDVYLIKLDLKDKLYNLKILQENP